jgi:uncharacterized protein (TIGR02145 family)
MKQLLLTFISLIFTVAAYSQQPRIQNTRLTLKGDKLFVTYDITGTEPLEKVWIAVTKPDGTSIAPKTVTGDIGHVTAGTDKKMVWDMQADGYDLGGQEISVEITSKEKEYFTENKEFLYINKYSYKILNEKDIIYLNNGSEIWGLVTSIKKGKVLIRMKEGNEIQFNVDEIKKIEINQEKKDTYTDSIYLTNGNILNAFITEMKPPEYIVIKIDKSKIKYSFEEIMKVKITCNNEIFIDERDGNIYKYIQIGDQIWMAENLRATEYSDGTPIPNVTGKIEWRKLKADDKGWCYYDNSSSNGDTYGALYTWAAAMNGAESSNSNPSGMQGVCPDGWHLPSDEEWKELEMALGMSQIEAGQRRCRGINEGSKLAGNASLWNSGKLENNVEFGTSGFKGLPGGYRYDDFNGSFVLLGYYGSYWSATESGRTGAWFRSLYYRGAEVLRYSSSKSRGFSVRCLKD